MPLETMVDYVTTHPATTLKRVALACALGSFSGYCIKQSVHELHPLKKGAAYLLDNWQQLGPLDHFCLQLSRISDQTYAEGVFYGLALATGIHLAQKYVPSILR